MYTVKALLLAFLAGVILAGGATYAIVAPRGVHAAGCVQSPNATPQVNEYAVPAPTTGGLNPNDLKTSVHPNLPDADGNGPTPAAPSSSNVGGH
jgi:hypothetical protein